MSNKLYWVYQSGGLCNQVTSIQNAIGFSYITKRELTLVNPLSVSGRGDGYDGVPYGKHWTNIIDLLEFPSSCSFTTSTRERSLGEMTGKRKHLEHMVQKLVADVNQENPSEEPEQFKIMNLDWDIFNFKDTFPENMMVGFGDKAGNGNTVSYFNRLFYGDTDELFKILSSVRFKDCYVKLSEKISKELGDYNCIHSRIGDFDIVRSWVGIKTPSDEINRLFTSIDDFGIDEKKMVICSNIPNRAIDFYNPIRDRFPGAILLEKFIETNYREDLNQLPHYDPGVLSILSLLVSSNAVDFWGTMGSTFTGFINRYWGEKNPNKKFKYMKEDFVNPPEFKFDDRGSLIDQREGKYSWYRQKTEYVQPWFFNSETLT